MDVSFPVYRPPLVLRSGHLQTVWPSLFRRVDGIEMQRERLELADGDFLDLDWVRGTSPARVAVLAHGLEGNSGRAYIRGMARVLAGAGWTVCAWNLRGCSGEPNRLLRSYHSAATEDLDGVVAHVLCTGAEQVAVVGFSLGGNLTLKWLGDQGARVDPRVVAGVGISVPVDLASSARAMEGWSRRLYMRRFMRTLVAKAEEKAARFDGVGDLDAIRAARTFRAFDGLVTAPLHGFESAEDYWARASARPVLGAIRVPTLLINALDDPFLGPGCYPEDVARASSWLTLLTPPYGGHVGFMGRGGVYWSEGVTDRFLRRVTA